MLTRMDERVMRAPFAAPGSALALIGVVRLVPGWLETRPATWCSISSLAWPVEVL